jgi:hypothetical protein
MITFKIDDGSRTQHAGNPKSQANASGQTDRIARFQAAFFFDSLP